MSPPSRSTGGRRPLSSIIAVGLLGGTVGTVLTLALSGGDGRSLPTVNDGPTAADTPVEQIVTTLPAAPTLVTPPSAPVTTPVPTVPVEVPVPAPAATAPAPASDSLGVTANSPTDVMGPDEAGRIAAMHVGGRVDTIHPENGDYGAAWDVDVYAPDGEYTVYVSATGAVVRVEGPFRD